MPQTSSNIQTFDAIIVGAGQAGPPLAKRFTKQGKTVALIERKLLGGVCVNVGCTPTKTLVASAEAVQRARSGAQFGFTCADLTVDMTAVMARKDRIVTDARDGLEESIDGMKGCTLFRGGATFQSAATVSVGDQVLSAPDIFLNVGARAVVPSIDGLDTVTYLTSSSVLELKQVPRHLIIVGGSYIGLEFAQIFRRFGAEVTVIEKSERLLEREDPDMAKTIQQILESEGVRVILQEDGLNLSPCAAGIRVAVSSKTVGASTIEGSHLLLAVGRVPNTDDLGADKAGLMLDKHGYIQVDDSLRTNVPGIWAMGDCNGKGAFTHTAYNDYEIVAANFFDNDRRKVTDRIEAHAMYTDPPLAQVGMTEAEARVTGRPVLIGYTPMSDVSRAVEKGETRGAIKILVDKETDRIIGASLLGPGVDEAIHCILTCMYSGHPAALLSRSVHIHPTVAELIPTTLQSLEPLQ